MAGAAPAVNPAARHTPRLRLHEGAPPLPIALCAWIRGGPVGTTDPQWAVHFSGCCSKLWVVTLRPGSGSDGSSVGLTSA